MGIAAGQRLDAEAAAASFVERHFPACSAAFLSGSVIRGEAHDRSDLDIAIIAENEEPRWATFVEGDWPIEVFVETPETYAARFASEVKRRRPLFLALCAENIVLTDKAELGRKVKEEAQRILQEGPPALTAEEIAGYRFELTWMLDDLADADDVYEARLIANDVAGTAATVYLVRNQQWRGFGKWLLRDLHRFNPDLADIWMLALDALYQNGNKGALLEFGRGALQLLGGPRFEGMSEQW